MEIAVKGGQYMKDNSLQIQKRLSALFLFLFLGVCAPGCGREEPEILLEDTEISGEAGAEGDRADASEEADVGESGEPEEIWVDIAGEVQSPGVYPVSYTHLGNRHRHSIQQRKGGRMGPK